MGQRNEEDIRRKTVLDILEKTYGRHHRTGA